ncbi:MAG TPA: agmatine deiminase family protein [Ignavibacteria bacterium]|nr:agmatine deiminase family protein [Ignavibacteria bacterium]
MKIITSVILFLILFCSAKSQDLNHVMSESEKAVYKNYKPPFNGTGDFIPPSTPVRTMAEWEEVQGIIVAWTSYTSIIRQIVDYAQDEGLVYIVCSDSNAVKTYLTSGGVPLINLKFLKTSFNSVWCRDYGPWAVYSGISDSLKLVDWIYNRPRPLDDQVSSVFAGFINTPLYQTVTAPDNLTGTGGNFMVDGNGTGFSSKLILNENTGLTESQINNIMSSYMGINRYIKMETLPYDQIHHIDMHIKLLDEETLLVGQYPAGTADGPQIEANLQYIQNNFLTCYGRPYKIVRIPMPPNSSGQYPPTANYYTYTNSVFINKTIIVPVYGLSQDTTALRIYRENLPGYRIVSINCSSMISALGAIHCITKEIGVNEPVFISHAKLNNRPNLPAPYEVKSYIKTRSGVASAKVYWRTDTTQAYNILSMTGAIDTFRASIPAQSYGSKIFYYISASSNSGRTITKPITAPSGYNSFTINSRSVIKINIIALPEGKYSNSQNIILKRDTVKVYLRQTVAPYNIMDSASGELDSLTFGKTLSFYNSVSGSYYIVIKHNQCIETWSKSGGESLLNDSLASDYNFTSSNSQAYGNNLIQKGSKFCLYSGDINNDDNIDLEDMLTIYNDAGNFISGNVITDLTGDDLVDLNDLLIVSNNSGSFVSVIRP